MGITPEGAGVSRVILALLPAQHTLEHIVAFIRDVAAYSENSCYLSLDGQSTVRDSIARAEIRVDFIFPTQPASSLSSLGASVSKKFAGGCRSLLLDLTSRNMAFTDDGVVKFIHYVMAESKASGATVVFLAGKDSLPAPVYSELSGFADEVLEL